MDVLLSFAALFIFILHELEEIVLFKKWFTKNENYLIKRFPRLGGRAIARFNRISTKGFALIALEETVVLTLLLLYGLLTERAEVWTGTIIMLTIHWLITIIQSIVLCRAIPGTVTAIIGSCLGLYLFWFLIYSSSFAVYMKWGILFFVFAMLNLLIMHVIVSSIRNKTD